MNSSNDIEQGQVSHRAAEIYEDFFVPALFGQWPPTMLDAGGVVVGDAVLDVGCGTGVLARAAADRVGPTGRVAGVDINDGMLAVAQRTKQITWRSAPAEALPFDDATFDRVLSQFALMFFADRAAAVSEMARVIRPGGTVTVATWAQVEDSPGYAAMVELLDRQIGSDAADALRAPFCVGTEARVVDAMVASFGNVTVTRHAGVARFASLDAWLHTDIRGWTLADTVTEEKFEQLRATASSVLAPFVDRSGRVSFAAPALIATAEVA